MPVEAAAAPFGDCHIIAEAQAAALRVLRSGPVTTRREVLDLPPGSPGEMPGTGALFERLLSLRICPRLTDDQVDAVCTAIADTVCRQFSREGAE
jgi:dTDP-4-amino-4,6-dideoxygalactose transaminase